MALSNYSELQAAITDWLERSDLTGNAADFITLAEASLNRKLRVTRASATLATVAGSRRVDVSSLSIAEIDNLYITVNNHEREVQKAPEGSFPYVEQQDDPQWFSWDGENLEFDREADQVYPLRLEYKGRLKLSDAAPTNDLLTNHPDVYLASCIVWGGLYVRDEQIASFKALLDDFLRETRHEYAKRDRGHLKIDPMLTYTDKSHYNGINE